MGGNLARMVHERTVGVRPRRVVSTPNSLSHWKQSALFLARMMMNGGSMKHIALPLTLVFSTVSFGALASPTKQVALPVGHTMTMAMPSYVTSVRVADPSLLEVKRQGRKVTLVGRAKGSTDATVMTTEGSTTFRVYVAVDKHALPQ
jgi:Flp pilus assembly secretin CpaC